MQWRKQNSSTILKNESNQHDLCFTYTRSFIFWYIFLGAIRNSEDLEYIVTNRTGQTVTTLVNHQERCSEYDPSGRNDTNQALTQTNATGANYGATNVTFLCHEPPPPYQENESAVSN